MHAADKESGPYLCLRIVVVRYVGTFCLTPSPSLLVALSVLRESLGTQCAKTDDIVLEDPSKQVSPSKSFYRHVWSPEESATQDGITQT